MTQAYRYQPFTVTFAPLPDESALLVSRTTRRAGLSLTSGKPRNIYERKRTPFAEDVVIGMYRLHREGRIPAPDSKALGRYYWEMGNA